MCNPIELFAEILKESHDHSKWDGATLARIKTISNSKVGSVGQAFIEKLCEELTISCIAPLDSKGKRKNQNPWDLEICGIKFELKTATEDTGGKFQFNHVRYHRQYEGLLCLGVAPENLYFGVWSKSEVATGKAGSLATMEKGANASYKLTKDPRQLFPISSFKEEVEKFRNKFITQN